MVSHRSLPTGLFAIIRFMGKAQASPRVQPRPGNRKDGRHDGSSSSAALSWWEKIKKAWLVIGVLISFVLGAFLFPKKVEESLRSGVSDCPTASATGLCNLVLETGEP